jgi:hypothetical protein
MRPKSFVSFSQPQRLSHARESRRRRLPRQQPRSPRRRPTSPSREDSYREKNPQRSDSQTSEVEQYVLHLRNKADKYRFTNKEVLRRTVLYFKYQISLGGFLKTFHDSSTWLIWRRSIFQRMPMVNKFRNTWPLATEATEWNMESQVRSVLFFKKKCIWN